MQKIYAIGDIHGQLEMLQDAHDRIERDAGKNEHVVVHLGDYTDRGPDSFGVIEYLIRGKNADKPWRFLLGNHDRMFQTFIEDPNARDPILKPQFTWLSERLGGRDTLASYNFRDAHTAEAASLHKEIHKIPDAHKAFLAGLETKIETERLFFVHAGINPEHPLDQQSVDDLIWIRTPFHESNKDYGKIIVHGHTPVERPTHYRNRINLDTGAGYGKPLTVAVFENSMCYVLGENGREPLVP